MFLTRCEIRYVLDFSIDLFDKGFQCSTIRLYRRAISAFYDPIEGRKICDHPRVSDLIFGIYDQRAP